MQTTTENAAREAVQAKPCSNNGDCGDHRPALVFRAIDEAEELRHVLSAGESLAELLDVAANNDASIAAAPLAELIGVHQKAVARHVQALECLIEEVTDAIPRYAASRRLAIDAADGMLLVRQAAGAFAALANLPPYAKEVFAGDMSDAISLLTEAMAARLAALLALLSRLRDALRPMATQGGTA